MPISNVVLNYQCWPRFLDLAAARRVFRLAMRFLEGTPILHTFRVEGKLGPFYSEAT